MAGKQKIFQESMRMAANFSWDRDWHNALKAYRAALQEFPEDIEAMIGLGTAYFELEQYESAVRALQRALKFDSANQDALKKMGEILERIGKLKEAAKTYVYAGNLYAKANYLDEAIENWERAIRADPEQQQARNNLAHAYARQGQPDVAAAELVTLAAIFQDQNDNDKALQYLNGAMRLSPNNRFVQTAIIALENGDSIHIIEQEMDRVTIAATKASAEDTFSGEDPFRFIDEDEDDNRPSNPLKQVEEIALEELAGVLFEDGTAYKDVGLGKPQIDALIGQAIDWQTRGDAVNAIATYEKLLDGGFNRAAAHFMLATFYMQNGQYQEAINAYGKAKSERAYLQGINFALGECFRSQNNAQNALKYFVEVLRVIDLQNARREDTNELNLLYQRLIETYTQMKDSKKTLAFVDSLRNFLSSKDYQQKIIQARQSLGENNETSVSAWIEFLEAPNTEVILAAMSSTTEYMKQNMLMTAVETCYRAVQLAPAYLPLHLRLAEIYMKQEAIDNSIKKYLAVADVYHVRDDLERVISIYRQILKVAPMDVSVRSKLVELYLSQNNIDAVLEQYRILADAYYQLAQVDRSLEKYKEALKLAPQASDPQTWQSEILHRIGDIYLQRVDWNSAVEIYSQLVKRFPEDDRALLALVDLNFKLGRSQQALAVLDKLSAYYNAHNQQDKLLEFLQDTAELRPHEAELQERLADFYVELGMHKQAIERYDILGEMQLEAGLRDDATRTIQRIIDLKPEDPSGYKQLLAQIKGGI